MLFPTHEQSIFATTPYVRCVGIDEVGRGCLAGPVAVGAFIYYPGQEAISGVADSKILPKHKRQELHRALSAYEYFVRFRTAEDIDRLGILGAITEMVLELVSELDDGNTYFVIDGGQSRTVKQKIDMRIRADSYIYSVAAASVLAKVERDLLMEAMEESYPGYGFGSHKGYASKQHFAALATHGPSPIHRRTFSPVAKLLLAQ